MITDLLTALLLLSGSFFGFTAALGLIRMPDIYMRMSTSGKAATLCSGMLLAAVAILFNEVQVTARAVLGILFLLLTVPVGAHLIARAAYREHTSVWKGTEMEKDRRGGE